MATETITVFSHIYSIDVDKDAEEVLSLVQNITSADDIKQNIEQAVKTVRKYESIGFYPMSPPDFIGEVIGNFSDVGLTREEVIGENRHQIVTGYTGCVKVFQLPDDLKNKASEMLLGFDVNYDPLTWEIVSVEAI